MEIFAIGLEQNNNSALSLNFDRILLYNLALWCIYLSVKNIFV